MGLSFITGGFSYLAPPPRSTASPAQRATPGAGVVVAAPVDPAAAPDPAQAPAADAQLAPPAQDGAPGQAGQASVVPKLGDLVLNFPNDGPPQLSLARAQMLMWTLLLVTLFVSKSAVNGALWNVPWELVALTGISQAGYVAPKFAGPGSGSAQS
jgi:hypothetical protein